MVGESGRSAAADMDFAKAKDGAGAPKGEGSSRVAMGRGAMRVARGISFSRAAKHEGAAYAVKDEGMSRSAMSDVDAYASVKRLVPIASIVVAACFVLALCLSLCGRPEVPEGPELPGYITDEMIQTAMSMQDAWGHPAGCTIAQIIQESGAGDAPSALAARDHNLFGMKWNDYFADKPGVTGSATWETNEEYDGRVVGISGTFIAFENDIACIEFRSSVFLQAERYRTNALIQEAIELGSSERMAQGLADAGWATDSAYADSLIALMDEYDLYRFDER